MDFQLFYVYVGVAIGFSVAAPIGPIGIFCIRQASAYGLLAGVITGLGASIADAFYTIIAGYGASFVEQWIKDYMHYFELVGGVFLIYLANKIRRASIKFDQGVDEQNHSMFRACWTTMIMTFLSPMTTFLFLAMFGKFGILNDQLTSYRIISLALGVFVGALLWWVILSLIVAKLVAAGTYLSPQKMMKGPFKKLLIPLRWLIPELETQDQLDLILVINRVSSLCIFIFGVLMILSGLDGLI
jgi:threonine/homoserine/homoserine lactone efflux protein